MDHKLINKALMFSGKHFYDSCHNDGKPVYLHSLRVAKKLADLGYSEKIVVGAILHDLIEDTDCSKEDIEKEFGGDMASLVECLSFKPEISDKLQRDKIMIDACAEYGKEAMIIKCADTADNSDHFNEAPEEMKDFLRQKLAYLLQRAEMQIASEPVFFVYEQAIKRYI